MAKPQAGSSSRLNKIFGFSTTVGITEQNKIDYADVVYPVGTFLHDAEGFLYHADGVMKLSELLEHPVVNKNVPALTPAEHELLAKANQAGGVVVTDEHNKINDAQLNLVENGLLKDSYLSKYVENGLIKIDALPADVRVHMKFLATYDKLAEIPFENRNGMFFVIDASGDPSVEKGWAVYAWQAAEPSEENGDPGFTHEGSWIKIQEGEGIDYDYDSITTYETVEKVGAVMYDHVLFMQSPTLDLISSLQPSIVSPFFTAFPNTISAYPAEEIPLGVSIYAGNDVVSGELSMVFTVAPEATVVLKGFDDGDADVNTPRTITADSASALNEKLAAIKVTAGATGGSFTMTLGEYATKTVVVTTKSYNEPTLLNAESLTVVPLKETAFPVQLSTDGIDLTKQYTVTVTPTGLTMKDDASSEVGDGSTWTVGPDSVENINTKLALGLVVSDTDGGTIAVVISEGASSTLTVTAQYAEPKIYSTSVSLEIGPNAEAVFPVSLTTDDVDPAKQYTVTVTPTGCAMKDDLSQNVSDGSPWSLAAGTVSEINAKLALAKVINDNADGGSITIAISGGASGELQIVTSWAQPTVEGAESLVAIDGSDVALGVSLGTTNVNPAAKYTVSVLSSGVNLKNNETPVVAGAPVSFINKTCAEINAGLSQVKVTGSVSGGSVTVAINGGASKGVNIVSTYAEPTILNADVPLVAAPNAETAFPVQLSTEGVSTTKEYTVTVTPNGCAMKDDQSQDVTDGTPWSLAAGTVSTVNAKLAAAKVVNDNVDGGSISIAISEGASATLDLTTTWAEPTVEGADSLVATNGSDVALGVSLGATNVNPAATYTVTVTSEGVDLKDDLGSPVTAGNPITYSTDTVANINAKLASVQVTGDTDGGSVTVAIEEGDSKTVTVNAYAQPTLEGSETLVATDQTDVALGITLGTTDVDPAAQYTVTVTSEGINLKDDTDAPIVAGTPITYADSTVEAINAKLALVKVTGDTDGGTVTVAISGGASKVVTVSAA